MTVGDDLICGNCGKLSRDHWAVNHADGPFVGRTILVCPTAVFRLIREPQLKDLSIAPAVKPVIP